MPSLVEAQGKDNDSRTYDSWDVDVHGRGLGLRQEGDRCRCFFFFFFFFFFLVDDNCYDDDEKLQQDGNGGRCDGDDDDGKGSDGDDKW
ncbi:hypothetical protein B296_00022767 [Ensete ventricosum]|uniref:Uncharacterized protein n=1 Tax=Ensete ventricosum TaxID=4639 RepID=A0A427A9E0_ENSVE|nr:hypothetical protein B296_00022767 [Ensete ventricosum]